MPMLERWRAARSLSLESLAAQTGLQATRLAAIEAGTEDFTGAELGAIAKALDCPIWQLLKGPPPDDDTEFCIRLLAQMLRDVCVEAVTTFDDMGRLDELKVSGEADDFWRSIACLVSDEMQSIRQTRHPGAVSAASETGTTAF